MKKFIQTAMVILVGLAFVAPELKAQSDSRKARRQQERDKWHKEMAEFKARSEQQNGLVALTDSIAGIQAASAVQNCDFVLQADQVTFKNGNTIFVNSNTTFIYVKGDRAVVQISPSSFASGPNGIGGITVDGAMTDMKRMVDKKGRVTVSFNVMGIGINAQIEVYMIPGTNRASATVYPNFNSNTVWMSGTIVPYDNSNIFEGSSL